MRRSALPLLLACAAFSAMAHAAEKKPRRGPVVPPVAAAKAVPVAPPRPRSPVPVAPFGGAASAFGAAPGLARLGGSGLGTLRSAADGAPVCRTGCAGRRYQCETQSDTTVCAPEWTRCVLACRGR